MILRFLPLLFIATACSLWPASRSQREHYFLTEVKPVLQQHCLRCHNGSLPPPSLNLTTRAAALKRSASGRDYILPEDPDCSLLVSAVQRGGTHPKMMPRTEVSLTDDQIGMLREWIEDGAYWPDDSRGVLRAQKSAENP
ncbi:c-type cytochrome domain-containing protein [Prosthecobacter sp.]|uniref:c-type cytochrome domain-containing protein n=1 Tax=Prosthecobacter sp. TaxID=1965333 RepID=UPI003783A3E5